MGYDVHITRQENWFDEDANRKIPLEEWTNVVIADTEMRLDNYAEATNHAGDCIRIESEGISVWTKYSLDGLNDNHAWFYYHQGNITVKNPDQEIINQMLSIADRLNSKVQGDNGEFYEHLTDESPFHKHNFANDNQTDKGKPWWQFW